MNANYILTGLQGLKIANLVKLCLVVAIGFTCYFGGNDKTGARKSDFGLSSMFEYVT